MTVSDRVCWSVGEACSLLDLLDVGGDVVDFRAVLVGYNHALGGSSVGSKDNAILRQTHSVIFTCTDN